jgi:hypothetical protein
VPNNKNGPFEIKLGYVMPILFAVGALVNLGVSGSLGFNFSGFNELTLKPRTAANYGVDPFDLAFAPVDPDIISDAQGDQAGSFDGEIDPPTSGELATPTPIAFGTELPLPTLPGDLPTLPVPTLPINLPTVPAIVPTVVSLIPTTVSLIPTAVSVVPTVVAIVPTSIPIVPTIAPIVPTAVSIVPTVLSILPSLP